MLLRHLDLVSEQPRDEQRGPPGPVGFAPRTAVIAIPADVSMPWWGYVIVGGLNAALGFAAVYWAPKNTSAKGA